VRLGATDPGLEDKVFETVELPHALHAAVRKRQLHFRAGRYCAREALCALDPDRAFRWLARASDGAPIWPDGITGSITHTDDFVSAAVARTSDLGALGIDTELIVSSERARAVAPSVAWASELGHARQAGCDRCEALTLVFSAKESIFKCLHPAVGRFFGFHDVRIVHVNPDTRCFRARIVRSLAEGLPADTILEGRYEIDGSRVHTGIALTATTPSHES
jgi:4'-phosphopantetheinyl transferase EntD